MANSIKVRARAFETNSKQTARARQQINPVREQQDNGDKAHKIFLHRSELCDAQSRRANNQNRESVGVEDRQSAESGKNERVPFPRAPEIQMEKGDGCTGRSTSETWMSGDRQKDAMRPWQSEREPDGCNHERSKRDGEPN